MEFKDLTITVVGLGVIGGSMAMALKKLSPKFIFGIDRDVKVLQEAKLKGVIDEGFINPKEALIKSDLVIVALYPKNTIQFIKDNNENFKSSSLIIDTTGIKESLVYEVQSFIRSDLEFLGTHPMAGKAEQGFNNADCRIFYDANYILTPTEKNSKKNKVFIENIIKAIGFKNIIELSPEEHDKIVAYTSHLPHILAVAIINSKITDKDIGKLVGGSFKDATRVADINSELWCELLCENSKYITSVIDELENQITLMKEAIFTADKETLMQIFNTAKNSRRDIQ